MLPLIWYVKVQKPPKEQLACVDLLSYCVLEGAMVGALQTPLPLIKKPPRMGWFMVGAIYV